MTTDDFMARWNINKLYHFTDRSNLPSIRQNGLLSLAQLEANGVQVANYSSNEVSRSIDRGNSIDGFVRLCFMNQHPMQWMAQREGRLPNPVFLEISPEVLRFEGIRFADGVAYAHDTLIFNDIESAHNSMDWEVLYTKTDWRNPEIIERLKKAKKYELLVPNCVPPNLILNL